MAKKRKFVKKRVLSGVRYEYRQWKEWDEDDLLIGKLVGTQNNRKNKSKHDWIVEVEEAVFANKKEAKRLIGKVVLLNTAGQFDKGMEQIEVGDYFQVTYKGSNEMEGGEYEGQMAHNMEVIEVGDENDEEDEDLDADDEELDEDEEESDEDDEEDEEEYDL